MLDFLLHALSMIRPLALLRWGIIIVLLAILWVASHYEALQTYFTARERRQEYSEQVNRLQQEQGRLQAEQAALRSGGFQTEKAIRERLLMVKPGEKILFIETPEVPTTSSQEN